MRELEGARDRLESAYAHQMRRMLVGRGADARAVEAEVLIAARGLQVLQVVAITRGEPVSRWRDRAQEFIGSLRPAP